MITFKATKLENGQMVRGYSMSIEDNDLVIYHKRKKIRTLSLYNFDFYKMQKYKNIVFLNSASIGFSFDNKDKIKAIAHKIESALFIENYGNQVSISFILRSK